jgi:hypothetical protein
MNQPIDDHGNVHFDYGMSGAIISACGRYRYVLRRELQDHGPRVCCIMLNPSTADGYKNDATIYRLVSLVKRWGYSALDVVNLYAWRATQPADMWSAQKAGTDIVGPDNDYYIGEILDQARMVLLGWGAAKPAKERVRAVLRMLRVHDDHHLWALKLNDDGSPAHPLVRGKIGQPIRCDITDDCRLVPSPVQPAVDTRRHNEGPVLPVVMNAAPPGYRCEDDTAP